MMIFTRNEARAAVGMKPLTPGDKITICSRCGGQWATGQPKKHEPYCSHFVVDLIEVARTIRKKRAQRRNAIKGIFGVIVMYTGAGLSALYSTENMFNLSLIGLLVFIFALSYLVSIGRKPS